MYGGSSSSVIKNNRDLLKNNKREKFVYNPRKSFKVKKDKYDHLVLDTNIKYRVLKENKKIFYKRLLLFIISFIGLMTWLISLL